MASVPKLLVILFFLSYRNAIAEAGDDGSYRVLLSIGSSLKTNKSVCSVSKAVRSSSGAATVPLHHRHGPCSPLAAKKKMPTLEKMLHHDQLRAAYIQRKFSGVVKGAYEVQQSATTVPTTMEDSFLYLISVRLGSPATSQIMFIDTGSDVSWVQCKPCLHCHSLDHPLFDPSSSRTYSPFSCSSTACKHLRQDAIGNGCSSSQCQYIVRYAGGTSTTGTYSSDTLALGSNVVVRNFQFGCSHVEEWGVDDLADGLMGLGGGAQSLVSQTAGTFGTAFSYCLPPTPSSSGFLTLGAPTTLGFVKTPMIRSRQPTFYGVRLEAIRVGGRQVNIPTWVFSGVSIMDSGTVITRLPLTAYWALSSAFRAQMSQYSPAPPSGGFDTCFDFSGQSSVSIPAVALVFSGGAVVDLATDGIMVEIEPSSSIWCLAFLANSDDSSPGIIGNVQQRTFEVLYDVGGGAVGFKARAC